MCPTATDPRTIGSSEHIQSQSSREYLVSMCQRIIF